MSKVLVGDFGVSNYSRQPVLDIVFPRILNTAALAGCAMLLAMTASLILGSFSAMFWNRPLDKAVTVASLIGICTPVFVTGIIGIYVFAVWLRWLPIGGMATWSTSFCRWPHSAPIRRRSSHGWCARAWSTHSAAISSPRPGQRVHRNAPWCSIMRCATPCFRSSRCSDWGHTLGGSVVTETIFNWPGLGRLMVDAILSRDLPVLQGSIFFFAIIFILVNLIVDILYTWADPRISYD